MDYSKIADFMHSGKKKAYNSKYFSYSEEIPEMLKLSKMPKKDAVLKYGEEYNAIFDLTSYKPVTNKSNDYFIKTTKRAGLINGKLKHLGTWDEGPVSMNEFRWILKKNGNKDIKFFETDKSVRITRGDDVRKIWEQNAKNAEADARKLRSGGRKTTGCGSRKNKNPLNASDDDIRKLLKSTGRKNTSLRALTRPPKGLPKMGQKPKSEGGSVFKAVYSKTKREWW